MSRFNTKILYAPVFLLAAAGAMNAQVSLSAYYGFGTATDSSANQRIDTFGNGVAYTTPKIDGSFSTGGAEVMFTPHFGAGAEINWRNSQGNYAGLKYRPLFYDFNGIWQPLGVKGRVVPELQGGLGGVNISYYYNTSSCDQFVGCSTSSQFVESANHVQAHMSAAVRFYLTPHIFLRPAVDAHWVNNFTQFGSNWVPEYSLGLGYTFGER